MRREENVEAASNVNACECATSIIDACTLSHTHTHSHTQTQSQTQTVKCVEVNINGLIIAFLRDVCMLLLTSKTLQYSITINI